MKMKNLERESCLEKYDSPFCKVVKVQPEGVLCSSGLTQDFEEEDWSNNFWN